MTVVALAGDWHGNLAFAERRLTDIADQGVSTVLHMGDFGIWPGPGGRKFLFRVNRLCVERGLHLMVTPGNHEDWGRLTLLWGNPKRRNPDTGESLPLHLEEHIAVLPRGYTFEMEGWRFVSLGGAPSVDFPDRTARKSWWPEEMIQPEDVERTIRNGAGADVMLAHDAPDAPFQTPKVAAIVSKNSLGWTDRGLAWAAVGRARMTEAFLGVKPRLVVHGHYHCSDHTTVQIPDAGHETRIWSLDCDGSAGNIRYLDLETLDDPEWAR